MAIVSALVCAASICSRSRHPVDREVRRSTTSLVWAIDCMRNALIGVWVCSEIMMGSSQVTVPRVLSLVDW
jgi:hypothetical protein